MYAFYTTETIHIGRRSRKWTAVGNTDVEWVAEMSRCLRAIAEGHATLGRPSGQVNRVGFGRAAEASSVAERLRSWT